MHAVRQGERGKRKLAVESIGFCVGGYLIWWWARQALIKCSEVGGVSQLQDCCNVLFLTSSWDLVL